MREGWGDDVAVNQSERAWRSAILIWRTDLSATYPPPRGGQSDRSRSSPITVRQPKLERTLRPRAICVIKPRRDNVFFRSRHQEPAGESPCVADISDAGTDETARRRTQQLTEWRRSAQRVTRAWNGWLSAETRDQAAYYRAFVTALAGEESAAAELERLTNPAEPATSVNTIGAQHSGLGAR